MAIPTPDKSPAFQQVWKATNDHGYEAVLQALAEDMENEADQCVPLAYAKCLSEMLVAVNKCRAKCAAIMRKHSKRRK